MEFYIIENLCAPTMREDANSYIKDSKRKHLHGEAN